MPEDMNITESLNKSESRSSAVGIAIGYGLDD
jgi:hypothetical protein